MRRAMILGERDRWEESRYRQGRQLTAWIMCLAWLCYCDRPLLAQDSAVLAELNAQTTPEKAIAFTWKTVLKECERTDGPSPSIFYNQQKTAAGPHARITTYLQLTEYSGPFTYTQPKVREATAAEKLNSGVIWTASAEFRSAAYRVFDQSPAVPRGEWTQWMDNGVLKLEVQKDRSGVTANLIKEHIDVIDPVDVSYLPVSCAGIPTLIPKDEAFRLKGATVEGPITASEFSSKLADSLRRRAPELKIDPSQYGSAVKIVSDVVQLCSSISASEFAASIDQYGIPHLGRFKDGKYKDCITPAPWRGVPEGKIMLLMFFDLEERWQRQKRDWNGPKFHVDVYLKETRPVALTSIEEYKQRYILLSVDVREDRNRASTVDGAIGAETSSEVPAVGPMGGPKPFVNPSSPVTGEGRAVLTVASAISQSFQWGHYWILRDDPEQAITKGGLRIPRGATAIDFMRTACQTNRDVCSAITRALDANGLAKVYADVAGKGTFAAVPPGNYHLMFSAVCDNPHRMIISSRTIELKPGANSATF